MPEIKLQRRLKYAGDVHQKLLEAGWPVEKATEFVENIPDADVEDVVTCDECIHYVPPDDGDYLGLCTSGILSVSHNGEIYPGRGFFCLYGERRKHG